jgi:hypothetical protein
MIGLLVLGALVLWFFVARGIAKRIAKAIPMRETARPWGASGLFVIVFLLPVADEIAARPYFIALCRAAATLKVDADKIRGKTVNVYADPSTGRMSGTLIPIFHSHFEYRDAASGEKLGEYDMYIGQGGLLAQAIGLASSHPITGSFFCAPEERLTAKQRYGFAVLN